MALPFHGANAMLDNSPMLEALHADGPAPDRAEAMRLYGRFIGSWRGTLSYLETDGTRRETSAEVHFDWALQGRAVQDVWIAPARDLRRPDEPEVIYGTTLRIYDPAQGHWHIVWNDPVRQAYDHLIGRAVGDDIVQEFRLPSGARCQWIFTDIADDSFRWLRRESSDGGATWERRGEFLLRRVASRPARAA